MHAIRARIARRLPVGVKTFLKGVMGGRLVARNPQRLAAPPSLDVKLPVPPLYRRGSLRENEAQSVANGVELIEWVDGIKPVKDARILDFGCGAKIAQALYQLGSPQALYVGVDVYREMIDYLGTVLAKDPKYTFAAVPFRNDMYNPDGEAMTAESRLPIDAADFDILLMFSVITHMTPKDSAATLTILRRYAQSDARLLFWAFADADQAEDFFDDDPIGPPLRARYRQGFLDGLIANAGWRVVEVSSAKWGRYPKTRYICAPA